MYMMQFLKQQHSMHLKKHMANARFQATILARRVVLFQLMLTSWETGKVADMTLDMPKPECLKVKKVRQKCPSTISLSLT